MLLLSVMMSSSAVRTPGEALTVLLTSLVFSDSGWGGQSTPPVVREQTSGKMVVASNICKGGDCPNPLVLEVSPFVDLSTGFVDK